jgi:hypothetical protein
MNARAETSGLLCIGIALAAGACAFGQVVWAASTPFPDRKPTVATGIGGAEARLSVTEVDHAVVARDPEPSI